MTDNTTPGKYPITKSESFSSHFATDAVVSGPTPDGLLHVSYLLDRVEPKTQSVLPTNKFGDGVPGAEGFALFWGPDDVLIERCLVGQVSLTERGAESLIGALMDRMWNSGKAAQIEEIYTRLKSTAETSTSKE